MVLPFHYLLHPLDATADDADDEYDNEENGITVWSFVTSIMKLVAMLSIVLAIFINLVYGIVQVQEQKQKQTDESESQDKTSDPFLSVHGGPQAMSRNKNADSEH